MIRKCVLIYLFYQILFSFRVNGYKPVFLLHGILTGEESMQLIVDEIKKAHPGTIVYTTDRFSGWSSLENAWHQVQEFGNDLVNISQQHPEGIHLVGYSQGGLIGRVVLETYANHNVKTFISLSSPQAGQYGSAFLHLIFPNLVEKSAFELFYSRVGQHTSVGNYWNDPHHQELYYKYSAFLPFANNEKLTANSTQFRDNLLKLDKMILIGGPDDGVITPWESSHFGFFNHENNVVPMKSRRIYVEDRIGLQTLDKMNKLKLLTFEKVRHFDWHRNAGVIRKAVIPYLD